MKVKIILRHALRFFQSVEVFYGDGLMDKPIIMFATSALHKHCTYQLSTLQSLNIASSPPENTASSDHWHLSHRSKHRVSPKNSDRATIVLTIDKSKIHSH